VRRRNEKTEEQKKTVKAQSERRIEETEEYLFRDDSTVIHLNERDVQKPAG